MKILSAKYLLPISSELIFDGAIAIENNKIKAVGTKKELTTKYPEAKSEYFEDAVIMPGLVNCHSHLELTAMRGFLDAYDDDFSSWLIKLTKVRADKLTEEDIETSALLGVLEGIKAGVTCFGDIGRSGRAGLEALKKAGLRGVLFQETDFSLDNNTAANDFAKLRDKFLCLKTDENELVKVGISPHAPYTVSRKLFESITEYSLEKDIKLTIHTAESEAELNLMKQGKGFFAEIYSKQNVNWEHPKSSTVEYFSEIGVLDAKPLLAHCVTVSEKDIDLIAESDSRIAHCPKSNAKFGHGVAPLEAFLDKKIRAGFGSDSMASNNTCDIFEESRFAVLISRSRAEKKRFLHAKEIIEASTIGGAKALGMEKEIGTLEKGKQADIIVVGLENASQKPVHDVYSTLLFSTNAKDVLMTMVAGKDICRNGISTNLDEDEVGSKINEIVEKLR